MVLGTAPARLSATVQLVARHKSRQDRRCVHCHGTIRIGESYVSLGTRNDAGEFVGLAMHESCEQERHVQPGSVIAVLREDWDHTRAQVERRGVMLGRAADVYRLRTPKVRAYRFELPDGGELVLPTWLQAHALFNANVLLVDSLNGRRLVADPGDWIVLREGALSVVADKSFTSSFEPVGPRRKHRRKGSDKIVAPRLKFSAFRKPDGTTWNYAGLKVGEWLDLPNGTRLISANQATTTLHKQIAGSRFRAIEIPEKDGGGIRVFRLA